jgi:hypothetical protein
LKKLLSFYLFFFSRAAVVVFAAKQVLKKGRRSRSRRMEGSGERQKK